MTIRQVVKQALEMEGHVEGAGLSEVEMKRYRMLISRRVMGASTVRDAMEQLELIGEDLTRVIGMRVMGRISEEAA